MEELLRNCCGDGTFSPKEIHSVALRFKRESRPNVERCLKSMFTSFNALHGNEALFAEKEDAAKLIELGQITTGELMFETLDFRKRGPPPVKVAFYKGNLFSCKPSFWKRLDPGFIYVKEDDNFHYAVFQKAPLLLVQNVKNVVYLKDLNVYLRWKWTYKTFCEKCDFFGHTREQCPIQDENTFKQNLKQNFKQKNLNKKETNQPFANTKEKPKPTEKQPEKPKPTEKQSEKPNPTEKQPEKLNPQKNQAQKQKDPSSPHIEKESSSPPQTGHDEITSPPSSPLPTYTSTPLSTLHGKRKVPTKSPPENKTTFLPPLKMSKNENLDLSRQDETLQNPPCEE